MALESAGVHEGTLGAVEVLEEVLYEVVGRVEVLFLAGVLVETLFLAGVLAEVLFSVEVHGGAPAFQHSYRRTCFSSI